MHHQETLPVVNPTLPCQKLLKLDGNPAIGYNSHNECQSGTVFSEENILLVVTNGSLNLCYGKSEYIVSKNQMAFIKNNTLIQYETRVTGENNRAEFILLSLKYELVREFIRLSQLTTSMYPDETEIIVDTVDTNLQKYMDSLAVYFDGTLKVSNHLIRVKLLELLFTLAATNEKVLDLLLDLRKKFTADITGLIEENLTNSLSINQLAVMAGRSLSSFRRDFLSIYNMPPSQWIREKRLNKAKEFLQTTNMTITDICYTLGFESISHFSRLFKSEFGYAPSVYRSQSVSAA